MPEVICNTSPLQYLHQLGLLHLVPSLVGGIVVPPAVQEELAAGLRAGINLPDLSTLDWIEVRKPVSARALPLVNDLGPGETEVLMLALESRTAVVILDDGLARQVAENLGLQLRGTLGLLLDAKKAGLISEIRPFLDQLRDLRFRLSPQTRTAVLRMAGEVD